jgi:hypothetical protein
MVPRPVRRSPPAAAAPGVVEAAALAAAVASVASSSGTMRQLNLLIAAKPPGVRGAGLTVDRAGL